MRGSTAAEGLPRIGRTSIAKRSRSCASHQSASCSENFVIQLDVPGQTLKAARAPIDVETNIHRVYFEKIIAA